MEQGGNAAWKEFWSAQTKASDEGDGVWKVPASAAVLEERYGGEVGEEWKERLSCRVEGREFTGVPKTNRAAHGKKKEEGVGGTGQSPARTASPAARSRKEANEAYFARMGNENASRPEGVAPSQGGKYAGFGSAPPEPRAGAEGENAMPGVDEFQRDPVAALTKGFGWFTSTVGKGAKNVNEGWVKPTAQKVMPPFSFHTTQSNLPVPDPRTVILMTESSLQIAEADLATQARQTALSVGQSIQTGTKGAADSINKFIDEGGSGSGRGTKAVEPERRDFWDSFGAAPETAKKAGAIGTAAMKKGGGGGKEDGWGKDDKWDDF